MDRWFGSAESSVGFLKSAQYAYKVFVRKLRKLVDRFLQGNLPTNKRIKAEQESKALLQFLDCFRH